jgi:hypothetical protein
MRPAAIEEISTDPLEARKYQPPETGAGVSDAGRDSKLPAERPVPSGVLGGDVLMVRRSIELTDSHTDSATNLTAAVAPPCASPRDLAGERPTGPPAR